MYSYFNKNLQIMLWLYKYIKKLTFINYTKLYKHLKKNSKPETVKALLSICYVIIFVTFIRNKK